jgi:hypothetical protein
MARIASWSRRSLRKERLSSAGVALFNSWRMAWSAWEKTAYSSFRANCAWYELACSA